jgi:hypothetical protein
MIDYNEIHRAYVESDAYLGRKEADARTPGSKTRWARARMFNDQAYFLMLFAQLEQHINVQVAKLIDRKKALPRWQDRRLWQEAKSDRISFMQKVALLSEKGQTTYNRMDTLYHDFRCAIAHGNTAAVGPIFIPTVVAELKGLAAALRA